MLILIFKGEYETNVCIVAEKSLPLFVIGRLSLDYMYVYCSDLGLLAFSIFCSSPCSSLRPFYSSSPGAQASSVSAQRIRVCSGTHFPFKRIDRMKEGVSGNMG